MHRLPVPGGLLASGRIDRLPDDAARHLKVVRPKPGEEIELFDGEGGMRVYRHAGGGALEAAGELRRLPRPAAPLALFACVTKGARWDWTIEKATELGVSRIVPVLSERCIVRLKDGAERAAKAARWKKIAEEAARQSDAAWLPEILEPVSFAESLAIVRESGCVAAGALADPPPPPLLEALEGADVSRGLGVFVGPEGDFTPAELSSLLEIARPASFGPTILRAETAAIFALSVLSAYREKMG